MASGRVAAAGVFLLACRAASAQQAGASAAVQVSAKRSPPGPRIRKCTHAQKMNILRVCWRWVKLDHRHRVVPPHNDVFDPCCNAVRDVRALDMNCIVDLLTGEERRRYDVGRIRRLERICVPPSRPPPSST